MASKRLKFGGILAALGLVLLILMMRSPAPESEGEGTARDSGAGSAHDRQSGGNLGDVSRPDLALPGHVDAEAVARSQRRFRELNTRRPAELEADPQFHKLLELDSARKMALLQKDPEELRRAQVQALQGEPIPRRVLEGALLDPNTEVRLAALYEISLTFDEMPLDLVAPVLQGDPNAEVRLEALSMVAEVENKEADALIESALDDPDEGVSSEAQDVLESRIEVSE